MSRVFKIAWFVLVLNNWSLADDKTDHHFWPYVDITLEPMPSLKEMQKLSGANFFTLAFINADSDGNPAWGGVTENRVVAENPFQKRVMTMVSAIRQNHGDITISFGGSNSRDLATTTKNSKKLAEAYQQVINCCFATRLDFDIEGTAIHDRQSVDRRSVAIAELQNRAAAAGKPLRVWFTVPVTVSGLDGDGFFVIESAIKQHVAIAGVNAMAMNFGPTAVAHPKNEMSKAVLRSTIAMHDQLKTILPTKSSVWSQIGITVMIGQNDVAAECFTLEDAKRVLIFAKENQVGLRSFWSATRDHPGKANAASPIHSGIEQDDFAFTKIMLEFDGEK